MIVRRSLRISALTVAVAAPAALLFGAGTAQAGMNAGANPAPGGVDVFVTTWPDNAADPAPSGWCLFNSSVVGNPLGKPLPAINVPFYLPENPPGLRISIQTLVPELSDWFDAWNISVERPNAPPQSTQLVW